MGLAVSIILGIVPMLFYSWLLYYLDRYEKEPLPILAAVFSWGAFVAAGAAYLVNTLSSMGLYLITASEFTTQLTVSTLVAPIVEESLKGAAVLLVYLLFRPEFDSLLDGVVYAGITALGFAATENIWYIHQLGYLADGWGGLIDLAIIRILVVGWQHPFYTAFIGLGFALARRSKASFWKIIAPVAGWSLAVFFHLLHNLFAITLDSNLGHLFTNIWDWSGYLALFALILILINREQQWMKIHLLPELQSELLSPDQYQTACSAWRQSWAFLQARYNGNFKLVRGFYQICGDLMHKQRQALRHGNDPDMAGEILGYRATLRSLAEQI